MFPVIRDAFIAHLRNHLETYGWRERAQNLGIDRLSVWHEHVEFLLFLFFLFFVLLL